MFCNPKPNTEVLYRQSIQPNCLPEQGEKILNTFGPVLMTADYSLPQPRDRVCPNGLVGVNPLLIDPMRGTKLLLDRPEYSSGIKADLSNIYTPAIRKYGQQPYKSYGDINAGQYKYWVPNNIQVFFEPVFDTPARVEHTILTDPMDIQHPQFNRYPLQKCEWNKCEQQDCNSFTWDTLNFRENLIASQMRRENERDYKYRVM